MVCFPSYAKIIGKLCPIRKDIFHFSFPYGSEADFQSFSNLCAAVPNTSCSLPELTAQSSIFSFFKSLTTFARTHYLQIQTGQFLYHWLTINYSISSFSSDVNNQFKERSKNTSLNFLSRFHSWVHATPKMRSIRFSEGRRPSFVFH